MSSSELPLPTCTTQGIRISVRALFVPEQSSPEKHNYVFAYRVSIVNESAATVQLMRRHWDIKNCWGDARVVEGDGVIGQQPVLSPGQEHTYVSGCVFQTPIGHMQGYYTMVRSLDGTELEVSIPPFTLTIPHLLN